MTNFLEDSLLRIGGQKKLNKEGGEAYILDSLLSIYLQGVSLNLNSDSFYYSREEKFNNFVEELKRFIKEGGNDRQLIGCSLKLKEHQRKLSPVVILAFLISYRWEYLNKEDKELLKKAIILIADTPKRLRELIITSLLLKGSTDMRVLPATIRRVLRTVLETYSAYTLLNNNIKKGPVTLRDMIKFFHPNPTAFLENLPQKRVYEVLYKGIIKNRASLTKFGFTNIVTEKSASKEIGEEALKKSGINQLIRNLLTTRLISENKYEIIKERLTSILLDLERGNYSALKVLNIFDIFSIVLSPFFKEERNKPIIDLLERILYIWIHSSRYIKLPDKAVVIQDLSGSMYYPKEKLLRSAIFLGLLMMKGGDNLRVVVFDSKTNDETQFFREYLHYRNRPLELTYRLYKGLEHLGSEKYFGGTALRDAVLFAVKEFKDYPYFIIISDEISWNDKVGLDKFTRKLELDEYSEKRFIVYNPERNDNDIQILKNVFRIAGLSTQIFEILFNSNDTLKKELQEKVDNIDEILREELTRRIRKKKEDAKKILEKLV